MLLTVLKGTLGLINLKTLQFKVVHSMSADTLTLAYDLTRRSLYWADDQGNIYKQGNVLYSSQLPILLVAFRGGGLGSHGISWSNGGFYSKGSVCSRGVEKGY